MTEHARRELDPPATPLKRGSTGPDVKRLQEWLCLADFNVAVDGDFGPATEAALKAFQLSSDAPPLAVDGKPADFGVASDLWWHQLTLPLAQVDGLYHLRSPHIAWVARRHLAAQAREVGKPNGGPFVRYFCRGKEVPWCAGFATTVLSQAIGHDDWYTLSCDEMAAMAKRRGQFLRADLRRAVPTMRVKPGDLFLVRSADGFEDWIHCGIVTAVGPDYFETIEGNTNTDGSREGTAVHARTRAFKPNVDFVLTGGDR